MLLYRSKGKYDSAFSSSYTALVGTQKTKTSCAYRFADNSVITDGEYLIGNNVARVDGMFKNCVNFNGHVTMPSGIENCAYMFNGCSNFNQSVVFPDDVTSLAFTFDECSLFNQEVSIPSNVTNCLGTFRECSNLNKAIFFSDNITDMGSMFSGCSNFSQNVTVGANVTRIASLLYGCTSFKANVYIKGDATGRTYTFRTNLFGNCNNSLRKNVWFNSSLNALMNETINYTIAGGAVTWTDMSDRHGFYNTAYNIYCYNNYVG